ncbi:MAG: lasso peptide biosynthesis PqqD family chaperone [Pseudonocardiaceae bacterium]
MSVQLRRDVLFTRTEYGGVLLDEAKGIYWRLNPVGATVVRAMVEADMDNLVRQLVKTFDVDAAVAVRDVDELLVQLRDAGLTVS